MWNVRSGYAELVKWLIAVLKNKWAEPFHSTKGMHAWQKGYPAEEDEVHLKTAFSALSTNNYSLCFRPSPHNSAIRQAYVRTYARTCVYYLLTSAGIHDYCYYLFNLSDSLNMKSMQVRIRILIRGRERELASQHFYVEIQSKCDTVYYYQIQNKFDLKLQRWRPGARNDGPVWWS